jgi:hypothetical protein
MKVQTRAIMGVPNQMADSFLCQNRQLPESTPDLKPVEAKYGTYYLSASRMNYGEEPSPALLLLWTKETGEWRVVAWAIEVPKTSMPRLKQKIASYRMGFEAHWFNFSGKKWKGDGSTTVRSLTNSNPVGRRVLDSLQLLDRKTYKYRMEIHSAISPAGVRAKSR